MAAIHSFERRLSVSESHHCGPEVWQDARQHLGLRPSLTPSEVADAKELRDQGKSLRETCAFWRPRPLVLLGLP